MSRYIYALGSVPVHISALTDFLRTRARWLRLDVMRDVGGTSSVYLRVGGPHPNASAAAEAARHFRDFCGVPIGVSAPADDEQDPPPKRHHTRTTTTTTTTNEEANCAR